MALILEIDHLLGVSFAARGPDSQAPDWPPQPDRVFSALVAAWGARGMRADERVALEWLERQDHPWIAASGFEARPAPISFVPPNDQTTLPAQRRRQPRRFPAALPHDPLARLVWDTEPDGALLGALDALAKDVSYVGHSASLTRCRFSAGEAPAQMRQARYGVYEGRLGELEAGFRVNNRPPPGVYVKDEQSPRAIPASVFSDEWMTFGVVEGGRAIDLRAAPLAAKELIRTIMSGYKAIGRETSIPLVVSGHEADGTPADAPHLAAAPLANQGFEYSDAAVLGFALIPPRGSENLLSDPDFLRALAAVSVEVRIDGDDVVRRGLRLKESALTLASSASAGLASMRPDRYVGSATRWATVTPMVLDEHLKTPSRAAMRGDGEKRQREIEALVAKATTRIGLPEPHRVKADRHSVFKGSISAVSKGPDWTRWRVPKVWASRHLTHAVIEFDEPVKGPVILGAGRHAGFGLCLPLPDEEALS